LAQSVLYNLLAGGRASTCFGDLDQGAACTHPTLADVVAGSCGRRGGCWDAAGR
jgi:hypothetical protein